MFIITKYTATCQRMYSKYEPVGDVADSAVPGRALQTWEERAEPPGNKDEGEG